MIRFPVNCHSTDSLFSWLSSWFLMKHLDIPSIDFPSHSERTHHCTWVSHSPHLQPFPAIKPFWNTIEFPVYLKEGPPSCVTRTSSWLVSGRIETSIPHSTSWEKQWKHMGKNNDQYGNTWNTHGFRLHKTFPRLQSVDFFTCTTPPWSGSFGRPRLRGACGPRGFLNGKPLQNPHYPIKNKDSTRKNGDIMGYNQQKWGARPAVTVSYGNPPIIGESSPHVST